jgi:hypothetical protein
MCHQFFIIFSASGWVPHTPIPTHTPPETPAIRTLPHTPPTPPRGHARERRSRDGLRIEAEAAMVGSDQFVEVIDSGSLGHWLLDGG